MLKPYWITRINNAQIGISACPLGRGDLKAELTKIVSEDELLMISLLTEEEKAMLHLQEEGPMSKAFGIEFKEFPIADMSIPGAQRFMKFIEELYGRTNELDRMLIHCRAGIGRSSLIALGLMTRHGFVLKESVELVSRIRGYDVPQSRSQRKLLSFYSEKLEEEKENRK